MWKNFENAFLNNKQESLNIFKLDFKIKKNLPYQNEVEMIISQEILQKHCILSIEQWALQVSKMIKKPISAYSLRKIYFENKVKKKKILYVSMQSRKAFIPKRRKKE